MKVAVEGCCHGELDTIYREISSMENTYKYKVDLLLICGDFQAIRNHQDLQCMAVPDKYKQLGGFHQYYTGAKKAPVLTIVIGGNHEASNYMWELYHGGWLAPNIYYLGEAGCVRVNGIRIAGASGIFKSHDFTRGHFERMPYDRSMVRSIYHIREYAVRKLSLLSPTLQVFLSHDWPQSITDYGDLPKLLQRKSFLRNDIMSGQLGSPPLFNLLRTLQPEWWFSAHLHTRFEACVIHGEPTVGDVVAVERDPNEIVIDDEVEASSAPEPAATSRDPNEIVIDDEEVEIPPAPEAAAVVSRAPLNPDEITLSDLEDEVAPPPPPSVPAPPTMRPQPRQPQRWTRPVAGPGQRTTNFLALDKCGNKREYLEVVDVPIPSVPESSESSSSPKGKEKATPPPPSQQPRLTYDPEWLAISRAFHPFLSLTDRQSAFPLEDVARARVAEARTQITDDLRAREPELDIEDLEVGQIQEFVMTAPGPGREEQMGGRRAQPPWYTNPQTLRFCELIGVTNVINAPPASVEAQPKPTASASV